MPVQSLYPPRQRALNVKLIRGVMNSKSQAEFEANDAELLRGLHPSLFAELDWMERSVPASQTENARRLVDGVFLQHLPRIVQSRRIELEADANALRADVADHRRFYQYLSKERPEVLAPLDAASTSLIAEVLAQPPAAPEAALERARRAEATRLSGFANRVEDRRWLLLMTKTELSNALARELDHLSSRLDAKQFVRKHGSSFDALRGPEPATAGDLQALRDRLAEIARQATGFDLHILAATCLLLADELANLDLAAIEGFRGERAGGFGNCGTCSMMYSSTAIIVLDSACPGLINPERGTIILPLDYNVSTCPFCGEEARAEAPSMFYAKNRGAVIYNTPRMGQFSEPQAREQHRPALAHLRSMYLQRVDADEREAFERAPEEFTYSAADFLVAIQMGTTAPEEHVCLLVNFPDGSGQLVDPTKGAIIALTRAEMASRGGQGLDIKQMLARDQTAGADADNVTAAMAMYAAKDVAGSRAMLERLHARLPDDRTIRRNLAVACFAMGDKVAARALMGS